VCDEGKCADNCGTGAGALTECRERGGNVCVDTQTDAADCGACGRACNADQLCIAGNCRTAVPATGCMACPCTTECARVRNSLCCTIANAPVCFEGTVCP
jgi:hypothetical protein